VRSFSLRIEHMHFRLSLKIWTEFGSPKSCPNCGSSYLWRCSSKHCTEVCCYQTFAFWV